MGGVNLPYPSSRAIVRDVTTDYKISLNGPSLTADRTLTAPNQSGTIALTSDIPAAPDLSGYALLAGRAGGQSLIGGTGSAQTLTLTGSSHATPGKVQFNGTSTYAAADGLSFVSPTFTGQRLTITSPTLTASAPSSFNQTWNNGAVTFSGFEINVTNTAYAAASKLFTVKLGSSSRLNVDVDGSVYSADHHPVSVDNRDLGTSGLRWRSIFAGQLYLDDAAAGTGLIRIGSDTYLPRRISANVLGMYNGTTAQEWQLYNTRTDASNYERLVIGYVSGIHLMIGHQAAGTGSTGRHLYLLGAQVHCYTHAFGALARINGSILGMQYAIMDSLTGDIIRGRTTDGYNLAFFYGKLRTHDNAATEVLVCDKSLTLYDAAGTAYKVPCVAA